ncbi:hypothetical protein BOW50_12390, partial [Solemya velum gill symbiont]|uniref:hypothetical protein n=1 Tax=Solemya velum gill symbiont TaxID=2340 RepID=UPI0009D13AD7
GTHVQSLWHSLLKNDGQMKMNGLGLIDQTFPNNIILYIVSCLYGRRLLKTMREEYLLRIESPRKYC